MPRPEIAAFWEETLAELRRVEPRPELTPAPEHAGREYTAHRLVLHSYGGVRLRGWYCVPKEAPPPGGFPAVLCVPGYSGQRAIPTQLPMHGYALLLLYPRAQGESKAEWDLESGTKLTYHLTDRHRFYYRAGYMDCVRGADFLAARPEVNAGRIGMWGRSQGGGFTLATAALDQRLRAAVGEEPFLCNYPVAVEVATTPYVELRDYLAEHPEQRDAALATLAYFDPLNLVDAITCPTLVNVGLRDETCPARTILPVFDAIRTTHVPKALLVYPELRHEACADFNRHALHWLSTYL
jgi:cephalosporin-C deacetylase